MMQENKLVMYYDRYLMDVFSSGQGILMNLLTLENVKHMNHRQTNCCVCPEDRSSYQLY